MATSSRSNNMRCMIFLFTIIAFLSADFGISDAKDYKRTSDKKLEKVLTKMQYQVTRKNGTEPPYRNEYWDSKKNGIYVDIVSGEPLFSSLDKYDSKSGWPSFTKALEDSNIVEKEDNSLFITRTEVRSRDGDSHLGHLFKDGPPPMNNRYCINSAALRFVSMEDLEKEGYSEYQALFGNQSSIKETK